MDGGGRFAQPLNSPAASRPPAGVAAERRRRTQGRDPTTTRSSNTRSARIGSFERCLNNWSQSIIALNLPRRSGVAASAFIVFGSIVYGMIRGDHVPAVVASFDEARDIVGNALGMHIAGLALTGQKQLSRDDVLASAGVTARTSLLFFDVATARARLEGNPWISEASVQKLYPDRLQIGVTEREALALWQHDGRIDPLPATGFLLSTVFRDRTHVPGEIAMGPGDRLLVYTDGASEACGPDEQELGAAGLGAALAGCGRLPLTDALDALLEDIRAHCAGRPIDDDVTLLLVERTGDPPAGEPAATA